MTVIDDAGNIVDRWAPEHTELGLEATLARLTRHGPPEQLPVAIERPSGLVVDRLLAAGHPVIPIHPNAFHAARPRWGAAAAGPIPVTASSSPTTCAPMGTWLRRLRPWMPRPGSCKRRRDCVTTMWPPRPRPATSSARRWTPTGPALPGLLRLGSQIALAFWDAYPTPESAARLGQARLAGFCRRHSYRGGCSPAELLGRLRSAPAAPVGLAPEVLAELVAAQVRLLRTLLATIAELDRALGAGLLGHAKAGLLALLPRIGEVSLAQVVAEVVALIPTRASTVEHATAECGAAPVTKASGKSKAVTFRWAANTKARNALATFAGNSRHSSPWAAKVLRRRPPPRQAPSPRRPHPRSGLAAGHVGSLAQRYDLRPRQARRRTAARRPNLTRKTQALHRPRDLPGHHRRVLS